MSFNIVILMGRLTADPETRYTQSGSPVANFTLAVQRRYAKDGNPAVDYINCSVCMKSMAEFCEKYLRRGTKIIIKGRWQTGNYTNKNGEKVYTNSCIVDSIEFAESKNRTSPPKAQETVPPPVPEVPSIPEYDPELPFN